MLEANDFFFFFFNNERMLECRLIRKEIDSGTWKKI